MLTFISLPSQSTSTHPVTPGQSPTHAIFTTHGINGGANRKPPTKSTLIHENLAIETPPPSPDAVDRRSRPSQRSIGRRMTPS